MGSAVSGTKLSGLAGLARSYTGDSQRGSRDSVVGKTKAMIAGGFLVVGRRPSGAFFITSVVLSQAVAKTEGTP